jgi:hypothetical protein
MGVTLKGVAEMIAKIRAAKKGLPLLVGEALWEDAKPDVIEAKKRSPVYTGPVTASSPIPGVLQDSIHAEGPTYEGNKISVEIVAGGLAGAYAIPQHERLDYHHTVGQAKFIESVIMEGRGSKLARVAARIDISKIK